LDRNGIRTEQNEEIRAAFPAILYHGDDLPVPKVN
jgi:hypothetical protein